MNANTLRRLNWLWKHRHTHDDDDFQDQITVIERTIEEIESDQGAFGSGAYIHLARNATQPIASAGEAVSWDALAELPRLEFVVPSFPSTTATIPKAGYYGVSPYLRWDSFTGGGTVQVVRIRDGVETVVWQWDADDGQWGVGFAPAIPFVSGDKVRIDVDHGDGSAQDLAYADVSIWLIDRGRGPGWELLFEVDNYGVTHDGTNFWTTDDTGDVDPALFERSADGTAVNSYSGYDNDSVNGSVDRNRGVVYLDGFIWGVGGEEKVHKIDPSDGSVASTFAAPDTASDERRTGIGTNGTNLFVVENSINDQVEEFTTAGSNVSNTSFPSGRTLEDITWDGVGWWATLRGSQQIIRMDSSFNEESELAGPTDTNKGIHWRNGFLYVMTPSGLYRRPV